MDIRSVDGRSSGAATGSGGARRETLAAAEAPSEVFDRVAGSVGSGAPGGGTTAGASARASVEDEAAATDGIVTSGGRNGSRSTNAQATMTTITTIGIRRRDIVGGSMRGDQYFQPIQVPRSEGK